MFFGNANRSVLVSVSHPHSSSTTLNISLYAQCRRLAMYRLSTHIPLHPTGSSSFEGRRQTNIRRKDAVAAHSFDTTWPHFTQWQMRLRRRVVRECIQRVIVQIVGCEMARCCREKAHEGYALTRDATSMEAQKAIWETNQFFRELLRGSHSTL